MYCITQVECRRAPLANHAARADRAPSPLRASPAAAAGGRRAREEGGKGGGFFWGGEAAGAAGGGGAAGRLRAADTGDALQQARRHQSQGRAWRSLPPGPSLPPSLSLYPYPPLFRV